jgi:tripartite-type tricarboxylate transporter receptor subunit TctC
MGPATLAPPTRGISKSYRSRAQHSARTGTTRSRLEQSTFFVRTNNDDATNENREQFWISRDPEPLYYSGVENVMRGGLACSLATLALLSAANARADAVADFYRGRSISLIIGYSAGGGYDAYGRAVARHMSKHIPGHPPIIPQNMPGAGSLRSANFLYNVAPKDGTAIGHFSRGLAMEPLIGTSSTQFDARRFTWLGSGTDEISICATWYTSQVKTWNDMLTIPFTVGGEGSGSDPDIFSAVMRNAFGARLKLVSGYPGSAEVALAIERGEIDGRCGWSWSSLKLLKPDWISNKRLNIITQLALKKSPELPDVPLIFEFATTDRQRQILKLVLSRQSMARPFAAPPDLPADRKAALRQAFDQTMADPEFLAEARQRGLEVNPVGGAEIDALVDDLYRTAPDITTEVRSMISEGAR